MDVVEKSKSKELKHWVKVWMKIIPMIISFIYVLNTVLSYIGIDSPILSYLVLGLFIGFMYLSSYAYNFCKWHRMFIHYILMIFIINIIDYHYGIPLSNRNLFLMYGIITGVTAFITLYLKIIQSRRKKS